LEGVVSKSEGVVVCLMLLAVFAAAVYLSYDLGYRRGGGEGYVTGRTQYSIAISRQVYPPSVGSPPDLHSLELAHETP
jgi:hypothetical protein